MAKIKETIGYQMNLNDVISYEIMKGYSDKGIAELMEFRADKPPIEKKTFALYEKNLYLLHPDNNFYILHRVDAHGE